MATTLPGRSDEGTGTGVVKRLREGYGFITGEDGKDYFVHWTGMAKESPKDFRALEIGDKVEFNWRIAEKGPRATDVMVIG